MSRHVLITGGAGFIGSQVCARVLAAGHRITVVDALDPVRDAASRKAALARLRQQPGVRVFEGDVRDPAVLKEAFATPPDAIIHLAGRWGPQLAATDPLACHAIHVQGTLAVLEAARAHGVEHMIIAAGDAAVMPWGPLAVAQEAAERFADVHAVLHGMHIAWVRLPEVYGPGQHADGPVALAMAALRNGPTEDLPEGPFRLMHVQDAAVLFMELLAETSTPGFHVKAAGQALQLTRGELMTAVQRAVDGGNVDDRLPVDGAAHAAGTGRTPGIVAG